MRKMLIGAAMAALALGLAPASADPGNGCIAGGGAQDDILTCTYTATGAATWLANTPNQWRITAERVVDGETRTVTLEESSSLGEPRSGDLSSEAGDVVTITVGPDCVPLTPVCGSVGFVGAGETE